MATIAFTMTSPELTAPAAPSALTEREQDRLMVERAQSGDSRAFDSLVLKYSARLYATVYHMTAHREDAHDILQDVFARAYRSLPRFRGESGFYTWIYSIAVNMTINFLKRRDRHRGMSLDDLDNGIHSDAEFLALTATSDPVREAGLSELQQQINAAMQQLSPVHRAVVTMFDVQGLAHSEIGRALGVSEGTVRSRLHYAHRQLQGLLADYLK